MEARDFFKNLNDGDKYVSIMLNVNQYNDFKDFFESQCVVGSIRIKNSELDEDIVRKDLIKKISKAKKDLRDYEFNKKYNMK